MLSVTMLIDSREQDPLPFPDHIKVHLRRSKTLTLIKVNQRVERLPAGDYHLEGFERECIVETKRSARELEENLLGPDFKRANNAFQRLSAATKYPLLVCEFGQADLYANGLATADALAWAVAHYGLSLWVTGPRAARTARRTTGELILRTVIARVELKYPNFLHTGDRDAKLQNQLDAPADGDGDSIGRKRRRCARPIRARRLRCH